jgi:carbonic anhydrase/acetyltransferase-like protein (isoleucine patch superfamily)
MLAVSESSFARPTAEGGCPHLCRFDSPLLLINLSPSVSSLLVVFSIPGKIMIRSYRGVRPTIPATCYVDDSAQIIGDVVLGEHASVWMNAVVRGDVHEIRIGAYSNVQDNSVLHGMKQQWGVSLGEYVTVGHSVTLHGCVIEDRCLIGMGSIILNGARVGAGSIIAAGTLIPEKTVVEPGSLWMGAPGKFRRKVEPADEEAIMRYARNYLGYKDDYLKER